MYVYISIHKQQSLLKRDFKTYLVSLFKITLSIKINYGILIEQLKFSNIQDTKYNYLILLYYK